jgi:hypothetical protein
MRLGPWRRGEVDRDWWSMHPDGRGIGVPCVPGGRIGVRGWQIGVHMIGAHGRMSVVIIGIHDDSGGRRAAS